MFKQKMSLQDTAVMLALSREQVLKLTIEDPDFPEPDIVGKRYYWDVAEIEEWMDNNGYEFLEDDEEEEEEEED